MYKRQILGAFIVGVVKLLFVSVCVCALNVTSSSPVSKGNVIVLSAANSDTATTYWWSALVSFICGVVDIGLVSVLFGRVLVLESSKTFLLAFGNTICLSAVGSVNIKVVSCESAVAPSKVTLPSPKDILVVSALGSPPNLV